MIEPNSNTSKLLYSTIKIIANSADGVESSGTAFFFEFDADGYNSSKCVPVLVTNRHVISGATDIAFFVHESSEDGSRPTGVSFDIKLADDAKGNEIESLWINHPAGLDLCAMPVKQLKNVAASAGKQFMYSAFREQMLPSQEQLKSMTVMENVIMVGSPIGLWDTVNNYPLLRRGMTASHPAIDFGGKPEGVIDIAAFPGSSGSPILIPRPQNFPASTPIRTMLDQNLTLLGILWGGPIFTAEGAISVVDIPTVSVPVASTAIPAHLGFYIKARELLEIKKEMAAKPHQGFTVV